MNIDNTKSKHRKTPPFITIEGVDGAGKSSHIPDIIKFLEQSGFEVVSTREPGGTEMSEVLRDLILNGSGSLKTEVYLAFASRSDNLDKVIRPALSDGKAVVCDRFTDSTYAYQGYGSGYSIEDIERHEAEVHSDIQPDLTLLFDLPVSESMKRLKGTTKTPDNFESRPPKYFEDVRAGYLSRVKNDPSRFAVIDSSQSLDDVKIQVMNELQSFVARWTSSMHNRHKP